MADVKFQDVVAISIGTDLAASDDEDDDSDGYGNTKMDVIIPRATTIPCSETRIYRTCEDNQDELDVDVLQGESQFARDCYVVARSEIGNIPLAKSGLEEIEVTFSIDMNGILNVTAKSKSNEGNVVDLTISKEKLNLPPEEMERLIAIS